MSSLDFVSYSDLKSFSDGGGVLPPRIIYPEEAEVGSPVFSIHCDDFYTSNNAKHSNTGVQVAFDEEFQQIEQDFEVNGPAKIVDLSLGTDQTYYIRVKYQNDLGQWSPWSLPKQVITGSNFIETPTNLSPSDGEGDIGGTGIFLEASPFNVVGTEPDTHVVSEFRIYAKDGELVYSMVMDASIDHMVSSGALRTNEEYEWTVRYFGSDLGGSNWSARTSFTTSDELFNDGSALDGLTLGDLMANGHYDSETDTGYFGQVQSFFGPMISGAQLSSAIGLNAGIPQNSNEPWLKFYIGPTASCNKNAGRPYVIYVAMKPFRYGISWNDINFAGAVFGTRQISINDHLFSVRLLTGAESDPYPSNSFGEDSEWNALLYRVQGLIPNDQEGDNWVSWSSSLLGFGSLTNTNGRRSWCQELESGTDIDRCLRGGSDVSVIDSEFAWRSNSEYGWRPVLELIS